MNSIVLGVDIGGSHMSAAPVDTADGDLIGPPARRPTPTPATPGAVVAAVCELADRANWAGPIGIGFPGVVEQGVVRTAAHLDPTWIGVDLPAAVSARLGCPVAAVNDADAAGLAEVRFGAAFGHPGVVVVVTLGTGVGTGVFHDGVLVPNTELGHLPVDGHDLEQHVAARARSEAHESWEQWGADLSRYLELLEQLLWPSLIVIGGGVSSELDEFAPYLHTRTPVVRAAMANEAGIVGAALVGRPPRVEPSPVATGVHIGRP